MSTTYEAAAWWGSPSQGTGRSPRPPTTEATREGAVALTGATAAVDARQVAPVVSMMVARPVATTVAQSQLVPRWNIVALPSLIFEPVPAVREPLRVGDYLLWPDRVMPAPAPELMRRVANGGAVALRRPIEGTPIIDPPIRDPRPLPLPRPAPQGRAFFAIGTPRLVDFSFSVQLTVQPDGGIRTTGATAIITIGVYAQEDQQGVERNRQSWTDALTQAGFGPAIWKFVPVSLHNLQASLDLPAFHAASDTQISTNAGSGTVTYVVQLSDIGALAWKSALEQRNGGAIAGICRANLSFFTQVGDKVGVKDQALSAPLGSLLSARGPDDVRTIYPQQTVQSVLVVVGHNLVETVGVTLTPNVGQAPATQVFGPDGGQLQLSVTTQDVASVQVDWRADVAFKAIGWPVITTTGRLSAQAGLTEIVKPDAWIATYTLMVLLVDASGNPVAVANAGTDYHVSGVVTFTAPYIPVTGTLVSAFDAANQIPVTVALPRFPGKPFGDLLLTLFATRDGKAGSQTRKISASELAIVAMVRPDAQIEIKTSSDKLPEVSVESDMLGIVAALN
jgi:hypothetical protein